MDEQLRKPEDEQNTNQDDSYSFMNETVKKRPLPVGKYLIRALEIIASACLFGLVAGLVFMHVTARNDKTVTITSDEEPVSLETAASESAAESAATVTPTPVPQPMTAEEKQQQTLDDYEQQNRAVYAVAETAMQSVVGVTGYSDATGWLSGNDPTSSSVSGLLVASTAQQRGDADGYICRRNGHERHARPRGSDDGARGPLRADLVPVRLDTCVLHGCLPRQFLQCDGGRRGHCNRKSDGV